MDKQEIAALPIEERKKEIAKMSYDERRRYIWWAQKVGEKERKEDESRNKSH